MYSLLSESQIHNIYSTDSQFYYCWCALPPSWIMKSGLAGLLQLSEWKNPTTGRQHNTIWGSYQFSCTGSQLTPELILNKTCFWASFCFLMFILLGHLYLKVLNKQKCFPISVSCVWFNTCFKAFVSLMVTQVNSVISDFLFLLSSTPAEIQVCDSTHSCCEQGYIRS